MAVRWLPQNGRLSIFLVNDSTIHQHQGCTQQSTADNIRKPVHAGNQPANHHKGSKYDEPGSDMFFQPIVPDAGTELDQSSGHHTQHQHGR